MPEGSSEPGCSVGDCEKPRFSGGLCSMHYTRLRRHGSLDDPRPRAPEACRLCGNAERPLGPKTGLCKRCYQRGYMRERRENNHELRLREREAIAEYRVQNREQINARHRERSASDADYRERKRRDAANYRRRNPDYVRQCNAARKANGVWARYLPKKVENRHARRAAVKAGGVSPEAMAALLAKRRCAVCGVYLTRDSGPRQRHIDHILPLAAGGTHTLENLRAVCRQCNLTRPKDGRDVAHVQLPFMEAA